MKEQYPEKIYATEKVGTNGINCLDYRNYNEDVEYVRADIFDTEVERRIAERMPTEDEIERQFPTGGLLEVDKDGKFNRPATIAMYDNLNRKQGARWVCERLK